MAIEELVNSYGTTYDALRLTTGDTVGQLWLELGGPDDRRAVEFAKVAEEVVNAAAQETALVVDSYVAEYVGTVRGTPTGPSGLDLAEFVVDQLRGAPGLDVYRRPALETRRLLAEGKPYDDAMAQAGRRAAGMAEADIGLAHRKAGVESMSNTPGVDGYRRTLTGKSCTLCMIASTQRYGSAELMPIHTRCDCRVAPIVGGTDYGRVINRDLYRELKASGELARFNKRNAGTSGRSRARAANDRRLRLEGIGAPNATELDLRRPANAKGLAADLEATAARRTAPPPSPAVRQHAELGPVLVNERHAYTAVRPSKAGAHRLDVDADRLARTDAPPPGKVTTQRPDVPDAPATPPTVTPPKAAKAPRYSVDSPEVIRAARRRNLPPERVADELNTKARRRAEEAAAVRAERKALTVDSPDVIAAANRYDVTPDEVLTARERVPQVRRAIAEEAARVQAEAYGDLYQWDALKLNRPPKAGARSGTGRVLRGGEYDWLEQIDARERARLSRVWLGDDTLAPDQLAETLSEFYRRDVSVGEAVDIWLDRNRRIEATGALRRGKLPSGKAYSESIDADNLLPNIDADGYQVSRILGDELDAAAHIASVERQVLRRDAEQFLGAALNPQLGPSPYRMSYQSWEEEVRELEFAVRNGVPVELNLGDDVLTYTVDEAATRLEELVPYYLDDPGTSFEELYARIISTAHKAGEEVPSYARIPWQ